MISVGNFRRDFKLIFGGKCQAANPKVVTVAYYNAQIAYPWYQSAKALAQNPTWQASSHAGPAGSTWKNWNLSVPAAADAWQEGCLAMVRSGVIDSCFVDGCGGMAGRSNPTAKHAAIAELQAAVPGPLICGVGGACKSAVQEMTGVGGFQE